MVTGALTVMIELKPYGRAVVIKKNVFKLQVVKSSSKRCTGNESVIKLYMKERWWMMTG